MLNTQEKSSFSELGQGVDTSKYFDQFSVDPGTLGQVYTEGEWAIDENLTAFDTNPVFTPNTPLPPKTEPVDPPVTIAKRYGAFLDVVDQLAKISFVDGCVAGSMSDAIAYIRYWSKNGQSKAPVDETVQQTTPADPQKELKKELDKKTTQTSNEEQTPQQTKERVVLTVPTNTAYQSRPRQPVPTRVQVPVNSEEKAGKVVSANPSGSVNGKRASAIPQDAVWTFMFNPEELQLEYGPDYNRTETFGVSDPKNSGQPLSWRSNKNQKLSFGKIILHGYSFGKRVDSLEEGLHKLFMSRDGENGNDGPPVLEFVWGKRVVFGPCVIQNIRVREKAWDKGILVNAEVSFDLEQVPEWTINDGFVDVLRPGRQPTVNDPSVASENYRATPSSPAPTGEDDPPGNKPGGGGGEPDVTGDPNKCIQYQKTANWFATVETETNKLIGFKFPSKVDYERSVNWYGYAKNKTGNQIWESFRPYLNKTVPRCLSINPGYVYAQPPDNDYERAIKFINGCAKRVKDAANTWVNNEVTRPGGACVSLRDAREAKEKAENKSEAEKRKAQEEAKRCEKIGYGLPCSSRELGSMVTCNGRRRRCTRGPSPTGYAWS